jgi:hypothetical protein
MKRFRDVVPHPYNGSWGGRIDADEEPQPLGSTLPAATDQLVGWAAGFWPQADPSEFEWDGMKAHHRESGVTYKINMGLPLNGELASGVSVFCVRGDRLILLRDRPDRPTAYEYHGTFGSRKIEYASAAPPEEGERIY